MERFVKGEIVVVPFPFSDLSLSKRRPALVIADLHGNDIILCQITSKTIKDIYSVSVDSDDFKSGNLKQQSNIRPNRIFTADKNIILKKVGKISTSKYNEVLEVLFEILKN
jgi:mRNA interferase MazF